MYDRKPRGFITLISVLILGAVSVAIAGSLLLLGIGSARTSFVNEQSVQAKALVDACAEAALDTIRANPAYTGTLPLTLAQGTCSATVTNTGGTTRLVVASSTVGTVIRRVRVVVSTVSPVTLSSWQEVAN